MGDQHYAAAYSPRVKLGGTSRRFRTCETTLMGEESPSMKSRPWSSKPQHARSRGHAGISRSNENMATLSRLAPVSNPSTPLRSFRGRLPALSACLALKSVDQIHLPCIHCRSQYIGNVCLIRGKETHLPCISRGRQPVDAKTLRRLKLRHCHSWLPGILCTVVRLLEVWNCRTGLEYVV